MDDSEARNRAIIDVTDPMRNRIIELCKQGWREKPILLYLRCKFPHITRRTVREIKKAV